MTTGTKIFLAVFALFIGILVVYYGMLMPTDGPAEVNPALASGGPSSNEDAAAQAQVTMGGAVSTVAMPERAGEPSQQPSSDLSILAADSRFSDEPEAPLFPLVNVSSSQQSPQDGALERAGDEGSAAQPDAPLETAPAPEPSRASPPKLQAPTKTLTAPITPERIDSKQDRTPTRPQTVEYIVKDGDTMVSIAGKWFGDENKWSLIAKTNPWIDPARMQIGQKLQLPAKDAKPDSIHRAVEQSSKDNKNTRMTYTVRSGDTLAKIAREYYGSVAKWKELYDANRAVIGDDPAALQPGTKLTLPKVSGRR